MAREEKGIRVPWGGWTPPFRYREMLFVCVMISSTRFFFSVIRYSPNIPEGRLVRPEASEFAKKGAVQTVVQFQPALFRLVPNFSDGIDGDDNSSLLIFAER